MKNPFQFQYKIIKSPIGELFTCATERGICLVEFADKPILAAELKAISTHFCAEIIQGENPFFDLLEAELSEYFAGKRKEFSVPLETFGTDFQLDAWNFLRKIPYGKTTSYKEQALGIGRPKSVRAVANANGRNRISILIPCHRVIGFNGNLTGYAGGLWRKKFLLDLEKNNSTKT